MSDKNNGYGAAPGDWAHFSHTLGLTRDLLPVVSDPNAKISEYSKVKDPGKTPSDYNRRGEMRGLPNWTSYIANNGDISKWAGDNRLGICLQTREIRAIDVDIEDLTEADAVEAFLLDRLGFAYPYRRRPNSSKFLVVFRMPGDFKKRRFLTKTPKSAVEFLATGQQCVISGFHKSGARYEWDGGLPTEIPELEVEEFEAVWSAMNERFGSEESVTVRSGISPTKKRQLSDMNDPLVDFMEDRGWIKDIDRTGRVDITCPFESEHTSDSGDSATSYFPAGVGGIDAGHFRCQHSHCAHRTDHDFKNEIGWSIHGFDEIPDPPTIIDHATGAPIEYSDGRSPAEQLSLYRNKDGTIKPNRATLATAVLYPSVCGCEIRYDQFRDEITRTDGGKSRPMRDDDYYDLAMRLETSDDKFTHIPTELMRDSVHYVARRKQHDSVQDWLTGLPKWDGTPRVDSFMRDFMGAEDTPYTRAVSRYFWSALAGRVMSPGIKADMVPIAVGKQGARKTTLIAAIPPEREMFLEMDLGKPDDVLARELRGKVVFELGELKGIGAKQVEHIKSFLSRQYEEWVPKYKEFTTRFPRRCVGFGTSNEDEPLPEDDTGQRRWLPFRVKDGHYCSVETLLAVRDQLWAEAHVIFQQHGVMWQDAERLAPEIHREFEKEDSWTTKLHGWIFNADMGDIAPIDKDGGLRLLEVIEMGLGMRAKEINMAVERRVGKCLRQIGLKKIVRGGHKVWVRGK